MQKNSLEFETILTDKNGEPLEIPIGGSLELLAKGDIGLMAWRKKRKQLKENHRT
ncbi:MAG: hypothetical protein NXI23_22645 [Bacteroidetes bacterium]|jgi:hypothetical protein|nr:hypothetical protein [Bacteroidota bacterium]MDF1865578.1 hypothetical protein [Saprospiraceae bacterium]